MASTSKLWLVAILSFAGLTLSTQLTATNLATQPLKYINLPPSVPAKIKITDKPADPAGKLVKLRYGPFKLPPNSILGALPEFAGGPKISTPCEECYIGAFQGGLEYEDGSEANVNTGMYLHHFVIVNNNKPDWLCGLRVGSLFRPQYVYNSGNERPPVRLNSKYKFGMRVDKGDTFGAAAELMNMSNETKTVYSTVIYEVIPLNTPGYREATHLRIDVWQCGASDVPAKRGAYKYTSPNFTSPYSGVILHSDGHGHDGATEVKLHLNGKVFCNSIQYYGLGPGWTQPHNISKQHVDPHITEMQYISHAVTCEDFGRLEKGDVVWTEAFYNGTKYPQMEFRGRLQAQMGISFLYIGRDESTLKDKLRIETRMDEFPVEMNFTSPFGARRAGRAANSTTFNLAGVLAGFGIPASTNLSQIFPGIPSDFNISDPYVVAPFPPFQRRQTPPPQWGWNALKGGLNAPKGALNAPQGSLNVPQGGLNPLNPATMKTMEGLLTTFVPGLPKGFTLSDIFSPGGIVISEVDTLFGGFRGEKGTPNPSGGFGGSVHRLLARSLNQVGLRYPRE